MASATRGSRRMFRSFSRPLAVFTTTCSPCRSHHTGVTCGLPSDMRVVRNANDGFVNRSRNSEGISAMTSPAQVGILGGTGHEGRGLAARLAAHGVPVLLGSRSVERAREAVERIAGGRSTVEAVANDDVVARCDLVVLAVPF